MSADKDLISVQQARDLVDGASKAQAEIAKFDQAKIDQHLRDDVASRVARSCAPGRDGG